MHDSAVRERQPERAGRARARSPPPAARPRRTTYRSCSARSAAESSSARCLGAGLDEQVDVDLEVAGADRDVDAVAVAACLVQRPGDGRLARRRRGGASAGRGGRARCEHLSHRLGLERAGPQPLQLAGRARQHDDDRSAALEHEAGRRAGETDRDRALRAASPACGRRARSRRTACPRRSAYDRETASISRLEVLVDDQAHAGSARDHLHRAVVVRRPEPARHDAEIGAEPFAQRGLEIGSASSPTIVIRAGSRPSDEHGVREKRAVAVAPVAADELAAGGDDRRTRPRGVAQRLSRSWTSRSPACG